jgi:shikimate kinase
LLERNALEPLLGEERTKVVALGGGALLEPELRRRALSVGFVITLTAPLEVLLQRIETGSRPLLRGDAQARAETLLETRAAAYADVHATIDTGALSVARAVEAVLNAWSGWR